MCLHSSTSQVDDIRVSLPVSLADGRVRAHQNGINIIIETDFDLMLNYDTVAGVILQIPSTYQSSTNGLCGNYNGYGRDDFYGSDGLFRSTPQAFAETWKVSDSICTRPDYTKK